MFNNASGLKDKALLATLLAVAVACGSVKEAAQSKAVRDRSRVLGLALMDDGTYQFRLCRMHKDYTAEILANQCINPLINEDGTARVFNNIPDKPGTVLAKVRNWFAAGIVSVVATLVISKFGRFFRNTKASDRLVGKARLLNHNIKVDGAKAKNDFELVERIARETGEGSTVVGNKDFTNAIAFVENYNKKVEDNITTARKAIEDARNENLHDNLGKAHTSLQEASEVLQQTDTGFNLDSKPMQDFAQEIATLAKQTDELRQAGGAGLDNKLQALEDKALTIYERVHSKEGLRLRFSDEEKKALSAITEEDSAIAVAVREWKHNKAELSLLDGSAELERDLLKLKDSKDELVEKLLRINDVVEKNDSEKTILQIKQNIDEYSKALKNSENKKDSELADKLSEAKAQLKGRIKPYNSLQLENDIKKYREIVDEAIKASPITEAVTQAKTKAWAQQKEARGGDDGLFASGLGKVGETVKDKVKFLHGFPWIKEDTLKYGKLNKITITDEDKVVAKLARTKLTDDGSSADIKNIDVQDGVDKLAAQAVGISAFLSLPLTAWSRYLPAHALLTAEKKLDGSHRWLRYCQTHRRHVDYS